jgi:putative ABC transport system permease protein
MNKWLQNFAYHTEMSWWMFILAGGISLVIAMGTVGFLAIKAATANPVESLRYE